MCHIYTLDLCSSVMKNESTTCSSKWMKVDICFISWSPIKHDIETHRNIMRADMHMISKEYEACLMRQETFIKDERA